MWRSATSGRHQGKIGLSRRTILRMGAATLAVGGTSFGSSLVFGAAPSGVTPNSLTNAPAWFLRDVQRRARWLPQSIRDLGLEAAYQQRWNSLPDDIRATIGKMNIPAWMVALVPTAALEQAEIMKQFRFMGYLAGPAPASAPAARAEQLLIFGGSAQLPTPGDRVSGASLGPEGCAAAISKYVLAQLKLEFPRDLARMSDALANSQSSVEMKNLFRVAARDGVVKMLDRPFAMLKPEDVKPGSITIAEKPGGTHVFAWTRVPAGWGWYPGDKMAIGNTGLPQYGDRMILAQEYLTPAYGELPHNEHGPINSRSIVYVRGQPDLGDPRTNVYAARGSDFILVEL